MKAKKRIALILVLSLLLTFSPTTAFAETPDSNQIASSTAKNTSTSNSKAQSIYQSTRRKEAKTKFDEKYGQSKSFTTARAVSPNGTYYEVVTLHWVMTPYLLVLPPKANEFEVTALNSLIPYDMKDVHLDLLFAPTDDRVVAIYKVWALAGNSNNRQLEEGSELVELVGNMGLIIDSASKKEIKTVVGGQRHLQGANIWLCTDSHVYAVENLSQSFDPDRPEMNFSPGEIFAYSLETGTRNKKFVLTEDAKKELQQIATRDFFPD